MLAYGTDSVAVGACALALHGANGLPLDLTPEVGFPSLRRAQHRDGIRVRYLDRIETFRYGSRSVAALLPALAQALPELPHPNAVAVLDDLMRRGLLSVVGAGEVQAMLVGGRGARRVRELFDLVDPRSESPLETFARLECAAAGVPPHELQVEILDDRGRFVARGDMGWRLEGGRWLIAEIDGREFHEMPSALLCDRARQNAMLATGRVDLLRFTSQDIAAIGTVPASVTAALGVADRRVRGYAAETAS